MVATGRDGPPARRAAGWAAGAGVLFLLAALLAALARGAQAPRRAGYAHDPWGRGRN